MNPARLKQILPRASKSFIHLNSGPSRAESERTVLDGAVGSAKGKEGHPTRHAVSVTSYRVRSVDPDNLCSKYFIDALRYAGTLHDDRPEDIDYSINQKKVAKKAQEKTLITVTEI